MSPTRIGVALAAVLSGPRLYGMVRAGELDSTGALVRAAIVAAVCIAGATFLGRLAEDYQKERRRREAIERLTAAIEKERAASGDTRDDS